MSGFRIFRRKVLADTLTPLAIYQRLGNAPYSYLLESVEGGERWARFSVVGLPAKRRIVVKDGRIFEYENERLVAECEGDPFVYLEDFYARFAVEDVPCDLPFSGGLVGYFAYESIAYIEPRLSKRLNKDVLELPDMLFCLSEAVVVLDNLRGEANLLVLCEADDACAAKERLDAMEKALFAPQMDKPLSLRETPDLEGYSVDFEMGKARFKEVVNEVKEFIVAGDVMQVVPSQRMSISYQHAPLDLYRALRLTNPSPYMYVLNMDDHHVIGSSPEILARVEDGVVTVRPIAGTRKRGKTPEEDAALAEELLADEKECAEHTMLIDLGRNDIGRVCKKGTVRITEKMAIERYSHVMHIVSNVEGEIEDGLGALDVFKATFPAGTLTGASKVRAMEIIDALEPSKRGIYGGAVGYWSWKGNMDLAIAIRTGVIKNQRLYIQAGAGVVYDSVDELEWQETINKSNALLNAAARLPE